MLVLRPMSAVAALVVCQSMVKGLDRSMPKPIPASAPADSYRAPAALDAAVEAWVRAALQCAPTPPARGTVRLQVLRQDHSHLHFGRSCVETPLCLAGKPFKHGLGTHSFSVITSTVPDGSREFRAWVGVDDNSDTRSGKGSVRFYVDVDGKQVAATPVKRVVDQPTEVVAAIPAGARQVTLRVDDGGDGPPHDQADWAEARFVLADGSSVMLDAKQTALPLGPGLPFSFKLGGIPSAELLPHWRLDHSEGRTGGASFITAAWTSPTGFMVEAVARLWKGYGAAEILVRFRNVGRSESELLTDVRCVDAVVQSGYSRLPLTVNRLDGDACGESTFRPLRSDVTTEKPLKMAPTGGRPASISAFPFFDLQYADTGIVVGIGWTGQWQADVTRAGNGPGRLAIGQQTLATVLHPGEVIRTPRVVLAPWMGDRAEALVRFRRLMLFGYAPRLEGKPIPVPISLQPFDRYWQTETWPTEKAQLEAVAMAHRLGCDSYWLDAAWFPGNFPNGVGNWRTKPAFPGGLAPVGAACKKSGMDFVLWFEPERVGADTDIAREHPGFVYGGSQGGLYNLGNQEALKYMTDLLSKRIEEYGVTVFRSDFNIDPLGYWLAADEPNRKGINEIRYIEGLYWMWDQLLSRHPGLRIDNCASGGRRIDLEMCSRAMAMWRSDTNCSPGHADWNQMQSVSLSRYIPLHTATSWFQDPYETRSAITVGSPVEWGYLDPGFDVAKASAAVAEMKEIRPYWYGDFHPITRCGIDSDEFVAWQLHRADLDAGMVMAFRRKDAPLAGIVASLKGIRANGTYTVTRVDEARRRTTSRMQGRELAQGLLVQVAKPGQSLLVTYELVARVKGK